MNKRIRPIQFLLIGLLFLLLCKAILGASNFAEFIVLILFAFIPVVAGAYLLIRYYIYNKLSVGQQIILGVGYIGGSFFLFSLVAGLLTPRMASEGFGMILVYSAAVGTLASLFALFVVSPYLLVRMFKSDDEVREIDERAEADKKRIRDLARLIKSDD